MHLILLFRAVSPLLARRRDLQPDLSYKNASTIAELEAKGRVKAMRDWGARYGPVYKYFQVRSITLPSPPLPGPATCVFGCLAWQVRCLALALPLGLLLVNTC